jgi:hypothetical protein
MRPDHSLVALVLAIVLAGCNAAAAADLAIPPRIVPKEISRDISIRTGPPNCSAWTDDCVNCSRDAKDQPAVCSNIGFACQPKTIRCLRGK